MATEFKRAMPQFDVQAVTAETLTTDAVANGLVDWGVERSDLAYKAHHGPGPGAQQIRGVALLQPLPLYFLVRPKSGIRRIDDLRRAKIVTGPTGTSSHMLTQLILETAGITDAVVTPVASRAPASAGLKDGTFDAGLFPGYVYPDDEVYSAIREGAYLLPLDGPVVDAMRAANPFLRVVTIPRNIYPGQDRLIPTIGIELVVICRQGLDDRIVHDATAQLFEVYPRLSGVEASLRFLNFDNAPATPIPLHPGAAKYYRELQLSR
jgi:TRAP transporter TAXI family solute receptor